MESILKEKIPIQISKHVDDMQFLTESIENLNYIIINLRNRLIALESKQPQTKVSPSQQRPEILFNIVKTAGSIRTKQVRQIFGLKQNHQAIRIMKTTARLYSENVYLYQSSNGHKDFSLNMKKTSD